MVAATLNNLNWKFLLYRLKTFTSAVGMMLPYHASRQRSERFYKLLGFKSGTIWLVVINICTHTNYRKCNRFRSGLSPGGIPEFKFNLPHPPHMIRIKTGVCFRGLGLQSIINRSNQLWHLDYLGNSTNEATQHKYLHCCIFDNMINNDLFRILCTITGHRKERSFAACWFNSNWYHLS